MSNPDLKDWIGRAETIEDAATATPVAALAAALDWPSDRPAAALSASISRVP